MRPRRRAYNELVTDELNTWGPWILVEIVVIVGILWHRAKLNELCRDMKAGLNRQIEREDSGVDR